ncbi:MAG TPA: metallophosphoesterase [Gemmata sp.]|jgi:3',5'-cyclic AMP phosphodiesterase CpdA|nr:metallophosphoesterase [Gemmata sp.]
MAVKLCHFSDVHLTARPLGWTVRDLLGKRSTGWMNVALLGRGSRFYHAPLVAEALRRDFAAREYDQLVFSGDATMLGFDAELCTAATKIGVGDPSLAPGIAVPGNHDVYVPRAERKGAFEAVFAPWQQGVRIANAVYPFARKVGHVWLIGLNSAKPNFWMWDATGKVGESQLARLRELTASLDPGPRIVVSHYPILTQKRIPEPRWHRLRNWRRVRDIAAECGVSLWLHGHRHVWYWLSAGEHLPFASICAGSATQTRRWGYHEYAIDGWKLSGLRRVYDPQSEAFIDGETFALELPEPRPAVV